MRKNQRVAFKAFIWLLSLLPLLFLALGVVNDSLGPDPGEAIVLQLGLCALWLLIATLSCRPLHSWWRKVGFLNVRRLLGLFCFFYAVLHLVAFAVFIVGFNIEQLLHELSERAYIVAGLGAIVCLLPLAITSTRAWQKRLGARWQQLHRLVYLAAVLVVVHVWWQVRSDYGDALLYTAVLAALMLFRLYKKARIHQ